MQQHNDMIINSGTPLDSPPRVLNIELPISACQKHNDLELFDRKQIATLLIASGEKAFKSPPVAIGTFGGLAVHAQIEFTYDYDDIDDTLVIHGNDDRTNKQLSIWTFLSSSAGIIGAADRDHQYRHTPNEIGANASLVSMWSDYVRRNPSFARAMSAIARDCNDAIAKASLEFGLLGVVTTGAAPVVTFENIASFKAMYGDRVAKEAPDGLIEEIIWMQGIVDSTYVGPVTWNNKVSFANVIGSTYDPKPTGYKSWYKLWADMVHGSLGTSRCSSYNSFTPNPKKWKCSKKFVGGHVILGKTARHKQKGSTIYIFPICNVHNAIDASSMVSIYNPTGLKMKYWL